VLLTVLVTIGILVVALVVIAVVAMGENGTMSDRAPELADLMATTARHLNGDAEPPKLLVDLFEELPELRPSARSADSASAFGNHSSATDPR
jgi:hypothetical protein